MKFSAVLAFLVVATVVSAEPLSIVGTGAGMDLLEQVAKEYMAQKPGAEIVVPASIGSGGGITAVAKDKSVMARISRPLKESESQDGLVYVEIAKMPIVFFTNPSANVKSLTKDQILKIFSGEVDNWKKAGGADLPILLVKRPKDDSSLGVLTASLKGFSGENISTDAKTQFTDQKALQYVVATKGSIAFGSCADAANNAVTTVAVEGVPPKDAKYPFLGILALIYKEKNLTPEAKDFLAFVKSTKARKAIANGYGLALF